MKRTINEIYELIKQKRENAEIDMIKSQRAFNKVLLENYEKMDEPEVKLQLDIINYEEQRLISKIETYTDVIVLLKTSQVLKEDK